MAVLVKKNSQYWDDAHTPSGDERHPEKETLNNWDVARPEGRTTSKKSEG